MPYFAYGPVSGGTMLSIRRVQFYALAADAPAAGSGEIRADVSAVVGTDPAGIVGRTYNTGTSVLAPVVTDTTAERRDYIRSRLRALEATPGLQAWTAQDDGERGRAYGRWIRMMATASAIDANLADNNRYFVIKREADHDGRDWYWRANIFGTPSGVTGQAWRNILNTQLSSGAVQAYSPTTWYSTVGPDAEVASGRNSSTDPNTRGAVFGNQIRAGVSISMVTGLPSGFDWVEYLAT